MVSHPLCMRKALGSIPSVSTAYSLYGTALSHFCAKEASRGFEPRSLDSVSRVLTVTPRGHLLRSRFALTTTQFQLVSHGALVCWNSRDRPRTCANNWPVGLMDKTSVPGAGDFGFESWAGHGPCCHCTMGQSMRFRIAIQSGSMQLLP